MQSLQTTPAGARRLRRAAGSRRRESPVECRARATPPCQRAPRGEEGKI